MRKFIVLSIISVFFLINPAAMASEAHVFPDVDHFKYPYTRYGPMSPVAGSGVERVARSAEVHVSPDAEGFKGKPTGGPYYPIGSYVKGPVQSTFIQICFEPTYERADIDLSRLSAIMLLLMVDNLPSCSEIPDPDNDGEPGFE